MVLENKGWFNAPNTAWVKSYFSDDNTTGAYTADYIPNSAMVISGSLRDQINLYSTLQGSVLIYNKTNADKTYYYWATMEGFPDNTIKVPGFADGSYGENIIFAIPFE